MPPPAGRGVGQPSDWSTPPLDWSTPPLDWSTPPLSWSRLPPFSVASQAGADLVDAVDEGSGPGPWPQAGAQLGDACVQRLRLVREPADAVVQLGEAGIDLVETVGHLGEAVEQRRARSSPTRCRPPATWAGAAVDLRGATAQLLRAGVELAGPVGDLAGPVGDLGRAVLRGARSGAQLGRAVLELAGTAGERARPGQVDGGAAQSSPRACTSWATNAPRAARRSRPGRGRARPGRRRSHTDVRRRRWPSGPGQAPACRDRQAACRPRGEGPGGTLIDGVDQVRAGLATATEKGGSSTSSRAVSTRSTADLPMRSPPAVGSTGSTAGSRSQADQLTAGTSARPCWVRSQAACRPCVRTPRMRRSG